MSHLPLRVASLFALVPLALAQGTGPWTQVCNRTTSGVWASATTGNNDISSLGRYVVFDTDFSLDPADTGWRSVYVRDVDAGTTTIASLGQGGAWPDHDSSHPAISATGRYVAFQSGATNLVPGNDPNFDPDVFVRDLSNGTTVRCSLGPGGIEPNDVCYQPDISADGRYVSFVSPATNLLANPGAYRQVFVFDRITGNLEMASSDSSGAPGVGHGYFYRSRLSGDGRYCVFDTFASFSPLDTNNTVDVYRKDLVTGQILLVSADPISGVASPGSYSSTPSLSDDGRFVTFATGSVFAANDTHGVGGFDAYVRDMSSASMTVMSVGMTGVAETSGYSEISADGRHVLFTSTSNNIVAGDTNSTTDLFVRDWQLGQTTRESVSYAGGDPNHSVLTGAIAANGRRLSFSSYASNLVLGDPQSLDVDCYARDRGPSATPTYFCISKTNSLGCVPTIGYTGTPSASGANPFHITAAQLLNLKNGTLFYGVSGPSMLPFQGGFLCVLFPRRTPGILQSGGSLTGNDCTGSFDRDFYSHIQSGLDPALVAGQEVWAQFWSRDPADPFTTSLTDALDFVIGP